MGFIYTTIIGERGKHVRSRVKSNMNKCTYIQSKSTYTVYYLADGPTDTHTRTHTQKKWWLKPLLWTSARRNRRAEDQGLSWTCPPRVVFKLTRSVEEEDDDDQDEIRPALDDDEGPTGRGLQTSSITTKTSTTSSARRALQQHEPCKTTTTMATTKTRRLQTSQTTTKPS